MEWLFRSVLFLRAIGITQPGFAAEALGTPFPGSKIDASPHKPGACGVRYKLTTSSPVGQVADYFLAQGRNNGLTLLKDTGARFGGYRMISFDEKGPGRVLFVSLQATGPHVQASVYYVTARTPDCS